jgi:hypothetical protein
MSWGMCVEDGNIHHHEMNNNKISPSSICSLLLKHEVCIIIYLIFFIYKYLWTIYIMGPLKMVTRN